MKDNSTTWDPQFKERLLEAPDFRAFLKTFFREKGKGDAVPRRPRPLSYAEFGRRAGLTSRSYARDFIEGSKYPGSIAIGRLCDGLGLRGVWREYFETLIALSKKNSPGTKLVLDSLRERIRKANRVKKIPAGEASVHLAKSLPDGISAVFAACGSERDGASLESILSRTRYTPIKAERALIRLMELRLIETKDGRYFPTQIHLAAERLGGDAYFQNDFKEGLRLTRERLENQATSDDALFFSSTVCISAEKMKEFKHRLRELMYSFVGEVEEAEGDCVAELVLGFSNNR